jgi:hypothetical protein
LACSERNGLPWTAIRGRPLALAKQARDLGHPTLAFLLETAALEASAGRNFPEDA